MTDYLSKTEIILADLISFATITGNPNDKMIGYIKDYLEELDIQVSLDSHEDKKRFNLLATIGTSKQDGIILSGHTDVVPAETEGWSSNPFKLRKFNGRFYGRGTVDMKGFLAVILAFAPTFKRVESKIRTPVHYALTFDEEEGTYGAAQMGDFLKRLSLTPKAAIVGEPTGMLPYNGHKGGLEMIAKIKGSSGHASDPRGKVNALYFAARVISFIENIGKELAKSPIPNSEYQPPYTTLSVGQIKGGQARNVIPDYCEFKWEIRPVANDAYPILKRIQDFVSNDLEKEMQIVDKNTGIDLIEVAWCPNLNTTKSSFASSLIEQLWTTAKPSVLSFGTDGAHYQSFGIDTIIFGPGDMELMHKPDEYIEVSAVEEGISFMKKLLWYCQEN